MLCCAPRHHANFPSCLRYCIVYIFAIVNSTGLYEIVCSVPTPCRLLVVGVFSSRTYNFKYRHDLRGHQYSAASVFCGDMDLLLLSLVYKIFSI